MIVASKETKKSTSDVKSEVNSEKEDIVVATEGGSALDDEPELKESEAEWLLETKWEELEGDRDDEKKEHFKLKKIIQTTQDLDITSNSIDKLD